MRRKDDDRPLESVFTGTNATLIAKVAKIWVLPDDRGMDVTWGQGRWKTDQHHRPDRFVKHDLYTLDGVDFRHLPEAGRSVDAIWYDPPYTDVGSRKNSVLGDMYESSLFQMSRVLRIFFW